jgi:hypothetical protein
MEHNQLNLLKLCSGTNGNSDHVNCLPLIFKAHISVTWCVTISSSVIFAVGARLLYQLNYRINLLADFVVQTYFAD